MHCPSCGNESSLEQKFCRKCGFNLEPVSKLFMGRAIAELDQSRQIENERLAIRRMYQWISGGFLVVMVGVMLLVINKGFIHEPIIHTLAALLTIGGTSIATYGVLSAVIKRTYWSGKALPPKVPGQVEETQTTTELSAKPIPSPVPSVTEGSTQLIGKEVSKS